MAAIHAPAIIRSIEDLSVDELRDLVNSFSPALRARLAALLAPPPPVFGPPCQLPCRNPDCTARCDRRPHEGTLADVVTALDGSRSLLLFAHLARDASA